MRMKSHGMDMNDQMMRSRQGARTSGRVGVTAGALLLAASVNLGAGQTAPPSDETIRSTYLYEMALRSAVSLGGQKLAQEARAVVPEVMLTTEQPIVRGVRLPVYGFVFDVQAPNIQSTLLVLDMLRSTRPIVQTAPRQAMPVADRTAATAVIEADPMGAPPVAFDATAAYTSYVREALMDAMLDSSSVLMLDPLERLTIVASGIEEPNANPLYRERKLIITIKGSDLQDFRQGRITRQQARERIEEGRF
jgi:hypothetical protein